MTRGRNYANASMDFDVSSAARSLAYLSEVSPLLVEGQGGTVTVKDALPKVRLGFLSKIYGLLSLQFLISTCMCMLFMHYEPIRAFVERFYPFAIITSAIASFVSLVYLLLNFWVSVNNALLMFTFTFCQSTLFGSICVVYVDNGLGFLITESLATSLIVFTGFTLYTSLSHWEFSYSAAAAYALLVFATMCSIANGTIEYTGKGSPFIATAFIFTTSTLFNLFILYDSKFCAPVSAFFLSSLCVL